MINRFAISIVLLLLVAGLTAYLFVKVGNSGASPDLASAHGEQIPPIALDESAEPYAVRRICFSDIEWLVKASHGRVGPGNNLFSSSPENVWVDELGRLHLRITRRDNLTYCAEVVSSKSFGYGTYRFYIEHPVELAPNVVLGLFTWSDDPAYGHREIDVELSRWCNARNVNNAQFVVAPYIRPPKMLSFRIPRETVTSTHAFTWRSTNVHFLSLLGHDASPSDSNRVIKEWVCEQRIPKPGGETPRINLWLANSRDPEGPEPEIIVSRFEFVSLP